MCIANKCVLLSPFSSSLEAMVLTLTWPSHASCLTPALFQRQNQRICCHFKAFVILYCSVILPRGSGAAWAWCSSSAAAGQQMQSLSGTFGSCLWLNLCSCCMQMVACANRNLPNKYTPFQLRRKGILGWEGAEQKPSSFLLPIQQAVQLYSHSQRLWAEPGRHCLQKTNPTSPNMAVGAQQRCWNSPGPQVAADSRTAKARMQPFPYCLHAGAGLAELPRPALRARHEVASQPVTYPFLPEGRSGCFWTAARAAWGRTVAEKEAQGPDVIDSSQRAGSVICLLLFRSLGGVLSLAPHQQSTCQQVCAPTAWPLTPTHSSTN